MFDKGVDDLPVVDLGFGVLKCPACQHQIFQVGRARQDTLVTTMLRCESCKSITLLSLQVLAIEDVNPQPQRFNVQSESVEEYFKRANIAPESIKYDS